ncbi:UNVERIFIED_CONTAM: hypothetical protein K2H54_029312, partial [Gekko kuhli]
KLLESHCGGVPEKCGSGQQRRQNNIGAARRNERPGTVIGGSVALWEGMTGELEEQDRLRACMLCRNDQEDAGTGRSRGRVSRKKIHARSPTAKQGGGEEARGPKEGTW